MHHPSSKWVRRKSRIKRSRPRPRWAEVLPFVAMGLFLLGVLVYFIYCHVTSPVRVTQPPGEPGTGDNLPNGVSFN